MGISAAWIAVQGLDKTKALETLGMDLAGPVEEGCLPQSWAVADLPDGWLLVYKEKGEIEEMEALAAFGPAVASFASESVMYSETRGYADGQEQWRIVYDADGEEGPRGLEVGGTPPPRFESILQEAKATQAKHRDADYIFDVPGEMAASVCGFMIGLTEPDDLRFTNLRKARSGRSPATQPQPKSGSFFARLFGRG